MFTDNDGLLDIDDFFDGLSDNNGVIEGLFDGFNDDLPDGFFDGLRDNYLTA